MAEYIKPENDRYIKLSQALEVLDSCACWWAHDQMELIPAADVRPVRRGKWSKELHPRAKYNQFRCSVCGKFSGQDEEGWIWKPNFCPNCGADMKGEAE